MYSPHEYQGHLGEFKLQGLFHLVEYCRCSDVAVSGIGEKGRLTSDLYIERSVGCESQSSSLPLTLSSLQRVNKGVPLFSSLWRGRLFSSFSSIFLPQSLPRCPGEGGILFHCGGRNSLSQALFTSLAFDQLKREMEDYGKFALKTSCVLCLSGLH